MKPFTHDSSSRTLALLLAAVCLNAVPTARAADSQTEFASKTIDIGVVVSDISASVKFYTEAIGFKEVEGFNVSAEFCGSAGITDFRPLNVRVLVLGDGPQATKLKLMQMSSVKPRRSDNTFIHSQLGYRYLTIQVTDTEQALVRLFKAGVKPVAMSPVPLPEGMAKGVGLTVIRDPDGNLIELVGPMKKR